VTGYRLFQPNRRLAAMLGVSLLLHVVLWLVIQNASFAFVAPEPVADLVELILTDEAVPLPEALAEAEPDDGMPRQITLMPERLAGAEPEQPDYLADVMSQAADLEPGGEAGAQPRARQESDVQAVRILPEQLETGREVSVNDPVLAPPAPQRPEPVVEEVDEDPTLPSDATEHGEEPLAAADEQPEQDDPVLDDALTGPQNDYEDWVAEQRAPSLTEQGDRGFEFDQVETGEVETNVDIVGGYRLNTYEWNFAPWIRRFANDLQRSWIPPYAYKLGLIDGRTEVRVVVERDGRPSRMDVLSSEGHESLHTASLAALKACAPYLPLPSDFPKEKLVIVFTLIYPEWRR
jgi:outer membrane biosynthesis protein TonB